MKTRTSNKDPKTISELCGAPKGTFSKFLEIKKKALETMHQETVEAIQKVQQNAWLA